MTTVAASAAQTAQIASPASLVSQRTAPASLAPPSLHRFVTTPQPLAVSGGYPAEEEDMERAKVAEALKRTVDPLKTKDANAFLDSVQKIIGFGPMVLEVVMNEGEEVAVRQAGVIYLKNFVSKAWESDDDTTFHIHEQDRHTIRQSLLQAITQAPEPIRIQLAAMVSTIVKADFPGRWPEVIGQISLALDTADAQAWAGALLTLYRLVKVYEYKKASERGPLTEAMRVLLPVLYQRMLTLMPNAAAEAVFLQKLLLKILYALVQFSLNFQMLSVTEFGAWLWMVKEVVDRDVPPETLKVEEEERPELVWWKAKKWAMHLLARVFERYGSPGNVEGKYKEFAEVYMRHYAEGAIHTALKVAFRKKAPEYVSLGSSTRPSVTSRTLSPHAQCWKWIKGSFDSWCWRLSSLCFATPIRTRSFGRKTPPSTSRPSTTSSRTSSPPPPPPPPFSLPQ